MNESRATSGSTNDEAFEYRSVHVASVLGLLVGLLSTVVWFTTGVSFETTLLLLPIPIFGLCASLYALRAIRSASEIYTGENLASVGAILSGIFLAYGLGYGSYVHVTEVPDGYNRISFIGMKPSQDDVVNRKLIPEDVEHLMREQEKVFIKGYIRPDSTPYKKNISEFLLVRDNQQCCFGDMSKVKYFDQIKVQLGNDLATDYSGGIFRLGGKLQIGPGNPQLGTPLTYYLEADYVNP